MFVEKILGDLGARAPPVPPGSAPVSVAAILAGMAFYEP